MHLAISINDDCDLICSKSTWGQWSGMNRPPSSARPCIKIDAKSLSESLPLVE
jgi:hypothetical protein